MPTRASQVFADYVQVEPLSRFIIPDRIIQPQSFDGFAPYPPDPRLVLTGGVDFASAPNPTNPVNLDIRVRVGLDVFQGASTTQTLAAQAASGDIGFIFQVNTGGFLELVITLNGSTNSVATSTTKVPAAPGAAIWLRAARTDSDGSVDFFTAPDGPVEPTVWTSLTPNRSTSAGQQWASSAPFSIGKTQTGATSIEGVIYRALLRSSGTIIEDFNPTDWNGGTSWVSSATGETWTLQNGAAIADVTPVAQALPYWGVRMA